MNLLDIEIDNTFDIVDKIFSVIPVIFGIIFVVGFVLVIIFAVIGIKKHNKNMQKVKDFGDEIIQKVFEKPEEKKQESEEEKYIVCEYCGMKNKKDSTKCSGCNAKL